MSCNCTASPSPDACAARSTPARLRSSLDHLILQRRPCEARVVVSAAAGSKQEVSREGHTLTWKFTSRAAESKAEITLDGNKIETAAIDQSSPHVAGFTTAAAETGSDLPKRTRYTGRRISLEFKDIDIQNLLRLFADISHKNMWFRTM